MSESSSWPCPSLKPLRAPRMTCGAWDMFSMPPASTVVASPRRIRCAPCTIDSNPEPQSRLTVSAGTSFGTPAFRPTCRAP